MGPVIVPVLTVLAGVASEATLPVGPVPTAEFATCV
jgi:hypothetical protein